MIDLKNKLFSTVLIIGLGESGSASAKWLSEKEIKLRLVDEKDDTLNINLLKKDLSKCNVEFFLKYRDYDNLSLLDGISHIIISPGISILNSHFSYLIDHAYKKNITIISEIELFSLLLKDLYKTQKYKPKIIAITGTNGKTTVTSLTSFLLNSYGKYTIAAGNIGLSALGSLSDSIKNNNLPDIWVLELSSFQLTTTFTLEPDVSTILNITQDHIDWHIDMKRYIKSKFSIFKNAETIIINRDDLHTMDNITHIKNKKMYSFGRNPPTNVGDIGIMKNNNEYLLIYKDNKGNNCNENMKFIIKTSELKIKGSFNFLNVAASLLLIKAIGIPIENVRSCLSIYQGEPHRNMFIDRICGVDYIDDSKATNIGATVAALEAYSNRKILILGGISKNQDFSLLLPFLKEHVRLVILIGKDAYIIANVLKKGDISYCHAIDMKDAINKAFRNAIKGDIVLLSPACSSLDMFLNYSHRGNVFAQEVNKLSNLIQNKK